MLENVRFEPGEKRNDPELAHALAELADVYVNDAFGVAHRAHASTEGVAHLLPSAAGRLLEREVVTLSQIMQNPARPLSVIIGGAKVADKIAVIDRFLEVADFLMIGGAMCFPFLCAQGHKVGDSLCDDEDTEHARALLAEAVKPGRASVMTPGDLVIGDRLEADAEHRVLARRGGARRDGWGWTSGRSRQSATRARSRARGRSSGTARWGPSSSSRSPRGPAQSPRRLRGRAA